MDSQVSRGCVFGSLGSGGGGGLRAQVIREVGAFRVLVAQTLRPNQTLGINL